jgi:hypothetical protein
MDSNCGLQPQKNPKTMFANFWGGALERWLISMGFRVRRSARLGPLRFIFSKGGLRLISVGGGGASFNIPVNRRGSPRTTVGLSGTGLNWSVEDTPDCPATAPTGVSMGLPNSHRLQSGQLNAFMQSLLRVLRQDLFAPTAPHGSR